MTQFVLTCEHSGEECDALTKEYEDVGAPEIMKGRDFFCSCPHGFHGGWIVVESPSAEAALSGLPPILRSHSKAYQVETMQM